MVSPIVNANELEVIVSTESSIEVIEVGVQGPVGPQGDTGATGATGPQGDQRTAAEILAELITVDGAGSGLDADLLDGQSSAYYATATGLSDHIADTSDAHDASAISVVPAGNIAATDVQAALVELDSEKSDTAHTHAYLPLAGGTMSGDVDLDGNSISGGLVDDSAIGSVTPSTGKFSHLIAGDPGSEGSGVTIGGTTYESSLKVSDLGGTNGAQFILHRHSTSPAVGSVIVGTKSNTDTSSHAVVNDGDVLMSLYAAGHDGTDYALSSAVLFKVDGTPGNNNMPGEILFAVSPAGSHVPATAAKIGSDKSFTSYGANTIDLSTDVVGLTVLGASGQTENFVEYFEDLATPYLAAGVRSDGRTFGANPTAGSDFVTLDYYNFVSASSYLPLSGGTLTGGLSLAAWTELSGESPDGWHLIPFSASSNPTSLSIGDDGGLGNTMHVYGHRSHIVFGWKDNANLAGNGAGYVHPFFTIGMGTLVGGVTFQRGWRFNDDPLAQGSTAAPYYSGIRTGNGTGMRLSADYTVTAAANNVDAFSWSSSAIRALLPTAVNSSGAFGTVEKFRVNTPTTALNNTNVVLSGAAAADRVLGIELAPAATTFPFAVYDSASSALASISTAGVINSVTALSVGSTVAGSGAVRLPNATSISWRNAANTGDKSISLSSANATDGLNLPGQVIVGGSDATAGTLSFFSGTVGIKRSGATGLMLYASDPTNGDIHINSNGRVAVNTTISAGTFANGTVEYLRVNDPTTVSNTANTMLAASATTAEVLVVQMAAAHSAAPFSVQNSAGTSQMSLSSGGTLTLTGGATIPGALILGTNPASTGAIRLANNTSLIWRNAANSADLTAITVDSANNTQINSGVGTSLYAASTLVAALRSTYAQVIRPLIVNASGGSTAFGTVENLRVNDQTTTDNSANVMIAASATTVTPLVVQLAAAHTDSAIEVQGSTGAVLASISPNGTVTATALKTLAQSHGATSATETLDLANGDVHGITLDANCTLTLSGATSGTACAMTVIVTQDATGGRTLTWPASVKWPAGTAPTLTGTANSIDAFTLLTIDGGTTWYGVTAGLAFA